MVSVRESHFVRHDFDLQSWSKRHCSNVEQALVLQEVYQLLESKIQDQSSHHLVLRAREIVECLSAMSMDSESLQAAIVFVYVDEGVVPLSELDTFCSPSLMTLVSSACDMEEIRRLSCQSMVLSSQQVDNMRRMLLVMVEDVRAVVIKLAHQVCLLREARHAEEEVRVLLARDASQVYAPLANRLGIGQLKWELEDLAFHYLHPQTYKQIAISLDEKRIDRERFIDAFVSTLQRDLIQKGVAAEVYGRPKHIASIWKKMQRKNLSFHDLFDVRAVRVLTENIQACYAALGVIHTLFKPVQGEFDDYIAHPKANGYQSIHTVVLGDLGKAVEIQIRTHEMHQEAELGVAAHWKYKEGNVSKSCAYESKINWLRKILKWQDDLSESGTLMDEVRAQVFEERVYIFTPKGEVINLPDGATVLDFAYYIHSQVGHCAINAKVDGRIVPFHYKLSTGEQVDIMTSKTANPKRDWLNTNLGYIYTQRARSKIQYWFRQQDKDKNYAAGKEILERELSRLDRSLKDVKQLHQTFHYPNLDDLLIAIGAGTVRISKIMHYVQNQMKRDQLSSEELQDFLKKQKQVTKSAVQQVEVSGVGNLMTHFAGCCQPLPGDVITGYISKGRGITVHRHGCEQLNQLVERAPERMVDVSWCAHYAKGYKARVHVMADDRAGLLRDVTLVLTQEKSNVLNMSFNSQVAEQTATLLIDLEVYNVDALLRLLHKLNHIESVINVKRC
tara:strand:- start:1065 stop:3254 length:2190 start_codon:yes stop_codon:yes gene_type:complete